MCIFCMVCLKVQQTQPEQQQRQQHFGGQQQFSVYQHGQAAAVAENGQDGGASFNQYEQQKYQSQQQAIANRLHGSAFSPSNEVSHVKFSSGDSSYNF